MAARTPNFSLDAKVMGTRMSPILAHVAHIRHLVRPGTLEVFLRQRYSYSKAEAKEVAQLAAPFLDQGLNFFDASRQASLRVRSVLQYYAYLNLATALVIIYRPTNWEAYRSHGVVDTTRSLNRISLSSGVIKVGTGALTLFNSILSDGRLPRGKIPLKHLVVPIPMVALELEHAHGIQPHSLVVNGGVQAKPGEPNDQIRSHFRFRLMNQKAPPPNYVSTQKFPLRRLYEAMPELKTEYRPEQTTGHQRSFWSKQFWTSGNRSRAEKFHQQRCLRFLNFGGEAVFTIPQLRTEYIWRVEPDTPLIPTLTAGLLLSFALASLSRYRANLLDRIESSQINLICEVFANEADGFMVPAMRNLLYAESVHFAEMPA